MFWLGGGGLLASKLANLLNVGQMMVILKKIKPDEWNIPTVELLGNFWQKNVDLQEILCCSGLNKLF